MCLDEVFYFFLFSCLFERAVVFLVINGEIMGIALQKIPVRLMPHSSIFLGFAQLILKKDGDTLGCKMICNL